jgi:surface polysaccharide O-acyltransferase-like enzyme
MRAINMKQTRLSRGLSETFLISNLLATVLIVAIHYKSKDVIDSSDYFGWNYLFQEFVTNGIARVAVPFFALIAGFFLYESLTEKGGYVRLLKQKGRSLLMPYLIGSCLLSFILYLIDSASGGVMRPEPNKLKFIARLVAHPVSVQFWFLRDLLAVTAIAPLLLVKTPKLKYPLGLVLGLMWFFEIQPFPVIASWYLVSIEVLFFCWLGAALYAHKALIEKAICVRKQYKGAVLAGWFVLIGVRIAIDPDLFVWYSKNYTILSLALYKLGILIGILSLMQIAQELCSVRGLKYLSGLTFFVYLFHFDPFIRYQGLFGFIDEPYRFYINFPVILVVVFSMAHVVLRYFPAVYRVITGGRNPQKIVAREGTFGRSPAVVPCKQCNDPMMCRESGCLFQ